MRLPFALVLCAGLAAGDLARLRELADARQLFLLREALEQPGWDEAQTLLYRGMVASRFGREREGIHQLRRFLAGDASAAAREDARDELVAALAREGRFQEAVDVLEEGLRAAPAGARGDWANQRRLYGALADVPPQSVSFGPQVVVRAALNPLGSWDVPVEVNGRAGQWIFDTGANWSTLSAGEAERLGLALREADAYVLGSTGQRNALRLAVADELRLGRARLEHVVFLVLADESLYIEPREHQIRGILGLPAIRALERVGIAADGELRIEPGGAATGAPTSAAPNLCFDGLAPIVEVRHGERRMRMFLDSGANKSCLQRSFRSALTEDELAGSSTKVERTGGAGGIAVRTTEVLPTLRLLVGSRALELSQVSLLTAEAEGEARYRDGVLGADALRAGFTLDFRALQLRLE